MSRPPLTLCGALLAAVAALGACAFGHAPAAPYDAHGADGQQPYESPLGVHSFDAPATAEAAYERASTAAAAQQHDEAIRALREALDQDPEMPRASRLLASELAREGDTTAALRALSVALGQDLPRTVSFAKHETDLSNDPRISKTLGDLAAQDQAAYAAAIAGALVFVGRDGPTHVGVGSRDRVVTQHAELYAWVPAQGRFYPLTETGGHVVGWMAAPDRSLWIATFSHVASPASLPQGAAITDAALWRLDLATLDLIGPLKLPAAARYMIGVGAQGEPVISTGNDTFGGDFGSLRTAPSHGARPSGDELAVWSGGARLVRVPSTAARVLPSGAFADAEVTVLSKGGLVAAEEEVVTCASPSATQPATPGGGTQAPASVPTPGPTGEIFVLGLKGSASDVATGRGPSDLAFVGETLLAWADGTGKDAALHVVDLQSGASHPISGRFGAGLHGIVDTPDCAAETEHEAGQ